MVMREPEFLIWIYVSGEGLGGGWIPGKDSLETTIWCLEWPNKLRTRMIMPANIGGDMDIDDL